MVDDNNISKKHEFFETDPSIVICLCLDEYKILYLGNIRNLISNISVLLNIISKNILDQ